VTNEVSMALRLQAIRQYGWDDTRVSQIEGVNSRLDELQAAVLRVRLKYLDTDIEARRRIAAAYRLGLQDCPGVRLPDLRDVCSHAYHQFVIRCKHRDALLAFMKQAEIGCAIHYPKPAHLQPAYNDPQLSPVSLRQTESLVSKILSLPMFPEMIDQDVDCVITNIRMSEAT